MGAALPPHITDKEDTGDFVAEDGDGRPDSGVVVDNGDVHEGGAGDGAVAGGDVGLSASEGEDDDGAGEGVGGSGADSDA